ncbi:hypothetical protein [Sanguibacter sp. 25GB23B1]|uniref:hypothetical protein n=1 Tax=unclassified Sanguibacter TaxID=2645534 RepID=UPI0032AFF648
MLTQKLFIAMEGPMILAFSSAHLRDICEDPSAADAQMGKDRAGLLRDRLADLSAADTYDDLLAGSPRIEGSFHEELRINIGTRGVIVLHANHLRTPLDEHERIDWSKVSYVKVVKVELQ